MCALSSSSWCLFLIKASQTSSNGMTTHGIPWKMEYTFTFHYEADKILSTTEFLDSVTQKAIIYNETVAAGAELNC